MKIRNGGIALMLLAAVILTGCGGGTGTPAVDACSGVTSKWALWSGGTCLRGATVWQRTNLPSYLGALGTGPIGPVFAQADFDNLAAQGANVVFISHPGLYTETPPYQLNTAARDNLDSLLAMIQKANMYAVISFRTGPGRSEEDLYSPPTGLNSVWTNFLGEQTAWADMWNYTANRYMGNPVVVGYDLMVEPHFSLPLSPPYDWNTLAKNITTSIRKADANTPILIGGMNYSASTALAALTANGDNKTVYTVHQYDPSPYTLQPSVGLLTYGTSLLDNFTRADLLTIFQDIATFKSSRGAPVGISEFGAKRFVPNAVQFLDDEMGIMENNGLNYSIWDWETTDPAYANVQSYDAFNFRRGILSANHTDIPNVLTTVIQKYFQKNTARPSNRRY